MLHGTEGVAVRRQSSGRPIRPTFADATRSSHDCGAQALFTGAPGVGGDVPFTREYGDVRWFGLRHMGGYQASHVPPFVS